MSADVCAVEVAVSLTSLRRLDWRFVLPIPPNGYRRAVLVGGADDVVDAARRMPLACEVLTSLEELAPGDRADLVAVLAPCRPSMDRVLDCLEPGAVLYHEFTRWTGSPIARRRRELERALRRARIPQRVVYAVRPQHERSEAMLPTEPADAARWFFSDVYVSERPSQRLLRAATLALLAGRVPLDLLAPDVAIVAGGSEPPLTRAPALLTHGGSRSVLACFPPGGTRPHAMVKLPKLAMFESRTNAEQQVLGDVRETVSPAVAEAVPTPLGVERAGTVFAARETCLPGQTISRRMFAGCNVRSPSARSIEDLGAAASWLGALHRDVRFDARTWDDAAMEAYVTGPIAAYVQLFGDDVAERRLFDHARRSASVLHGVSFPTVWQHRDFTTNNIVRDRTGHLGVIDWEGARRGPPVVDLLHLLTMWHLRLAGSSTARQARSLAAVHDMLTTGEASDRAAVGSAAARSRYFERTGLTPRLAAALHLPMMVELACRRHDELEAAADERAAPGDLRGRIVEAQLVHSLAVAIQRRGAT